MKTMLRLTVLLVALASAALADSTARIVQYHAKDIVNIRAKVKYTTLIELPSAEKIMEAATGDKDFWIIDVVGNFCLIHPATPGIRSNLNLITDKGNIYSFTVEDVSEQKLEPDLKVILQPVEESSIANVGGSSVFAPTAELEAMRSQVQLTLSRAAQEAEQYRSQYPTKLRFDYHYKNDKRFAITSIYHDDKFTYIKTDAREKFAVYELKDHSPNFINYDLREGTYIIAKVLDHGYLQIGKKHLEFTRKDGKDTQ